MKTIKHWLNILIFILLLPLIIPVGHILGKQIEELLDLLVNLIT